MKNILLFLTCVFSIFLTTKPAQAFELMGERTAQFEKRTYHSYTGLASIEYYLLKPAHYDPKKSYPLVLTLHGASGHSYGAYALAGPEFQNRYPAFVLVPEIKLNSWTLPLYTDFRQEPSQHVVSIIKRLEEEFSIDRTRIYITGYSIGGNGTLEMIDENPELFAAGAGLSCGKFSGNVSNLIKTPLWILHGKLDSGMDVNVTREMVGRIQHAGGNVRYTEFPDQSHNIWEGIYNSPGFWDWFFAQKRT